MSQLVSSVICSVVGALQDNTQPLFTRLQDRLGPSRCVTHPDVSPCFRVVHTADLVLWLTCAPVTLPCVHTIFQLVSMSRNFVRDEIQRQQHGVVHRVVLCSSAGGERTSAQRNAIMLPGGRSHTSSLAYALQCRLPMRSSPV